MTTESENFFAEFAKKNEENPEVKKDTGIVESPAVLDVNQGNKSEEDIDAEQKLLLEQEEANKPEEKVVEETEEEKIAKENQEKLAKEEAENKSKEEVKQPTLEEIKKQLLEELDSKNKAEKLAKEKEDKEKLEKEEADKKAKEEENWNPESVWSDEEKQNLKDLEENFPEAYKGLQSIEKKLTALFDKKLQKEILNYDAHVARIINPLVNVQIESQAQVEQREVLNIHPDFEETLPKVETWISSMQNGQMKKGLSEAFENGTYKDVIELFSMYKQLNGISNSNVNETVKQQELQKKATEDAKKAEAERIKKEKALALGAVSSSHTQIDNKSSDGKGFEDWFKTFAK